MCGFTFPPQSKIAMLSHELPVPLMFAGIPAVAGDGVPGRLPVEDADRAGVARGVLHGV